MIVNLGEWASYLYRLLEAHVILSPLESCCVLTLEKVNNVIRKFKKISDTHQDYCSRFDGTSFKTEPSSKFPHKAVGALGSYRHSAFVTGSYSSTNGLKTEILDYQAKQWHQADDFPFSNGDRLILKYVKQENLYPE